VASCLIVDDEPDARLLVRLTVERSAIAVVGEASSGDEAIECWRRLRPDVIVLDHVMPGRSGLDTAEQILAQDPAQLIVLFSARCDEALARRARDLGVSAYLSKGDPGRLRATLLALLEEGSGSVSRRDAPRGPDAGS
jgi:DNA-binding NarL/FixJ family response regulator